MVYVSLYRKYRPQTFAEILGQAHVSTTLANAIKEGRVAHAYLFTGPRGTGKTSTARILAKALNCELGPTPEPCGKCDSCVAIAEGSSLDVFEMDAASHSGVDDTREILAGVPLATAGGRKKVYVIDEVHMLTTQSFNALLKTLEEPPGHVVFVLATTEAHKVIPTIVSRTQRFDFRRIPAPVLEEHLSHIAKAENIDIEPAAIATIARRAEGGARDALSALDQLASLEGRISEADADRLLGERGEDAFVELFDAIASGDVGALFVILDSLVTQGSDVRQLALGALAHARSLLLLRTAPDAGGLLDVSDEDRPVLLAQSERFSTAGLLRSLDLIGKSVTEMRNAPNHRLFLEVALARAAAPDTDATPDGLLARIERVERRMGIEQQQQAGSEPAPAARRPEKKQPQAAPAPAPQEAQQEAQQEAPQEEQQAAPAAVSADHIGLNHIKDAWPAAMKEVNKRSKRVGAFLNPSHPTRFDSDELTVEVQSEFHAGAMSEERNREMLAESLFAALGLKPRLLFVERGAVEQPAVEQDASENMATYAESGPAAEGEHDPVELLKKGLGAEVVRGVDDPH